MSLMTEKEFKNLMGLGDKGPDGTATWGVKRFDVSYDDCIKESIEEMAKKFHVGSKSLDWKLFTWGRNVIASDLPVQEALKLANVQGIAPMYYPLIVAAAKAKVDKAFNKDFKPYDTYEKKGNIWVNTGRNEIMKLAIGATAQAYDNATADLGVGNSATAPGVGDTALIGGSTLYKIMNATYPLTPASEQFDAQATFGDAEAKFDWLEEAFRNGSGDAILWNRANTDLGDKTSVTETWILTATLTW